MLAGFLAGAAACGGFGAGDAGWAAFGGALWTGAEEGVGVGASGVLVMGCVMVWTTVEALVVVEFCSAGWITAECQLYILPDVSPILARKDVRVGSP